MPIGSNILAGASGQATGYDIDQSLRFEEDDASKLSRTFTSAGNRKTWTLSTWVKLSGLDTADHGELFNGYDSGSDTGFTAVYWINGKLKVAGWSTFWRETSQEFRDPSAWYHLVVAFDTTQASANDRCKIYVNGSQVTDFDTNNALSQNTDYGINGAWVHQIGQDNSASSSRNFSGYMAEFHFIDGTALDASSFGETNSATNQWVPIEVTGMTYGTNGFYLPFSSTELANSFTDSSAYSDLVFTPSTSLSVDYLIVGGGGSGGGTWYYGGGGAGGVRTGTGHSVTAQDYTITVGTGGLSSETTSPFGKGGDSAFDSITATGGGHGGNDNSGTSQVGGDGGSGGGGRGGIGGSGPSIAGGSGNTPSTSPSQGNNGGASGANDGGGGGGGGAGGAGSAGTAGNGGSAAGGTGGAGIQNDITGTNTYYAAGGGGARGYPPGSSGSGGTGWSASGYGMGGGGGSVMDGTDGVVIISYASASPQATGGTITSYTDSGTTYQVHTFNAAHSAHTITANGDVANSRAQKKIGSSSIKFDGTGDYLSVPANSDWNFGSSDFTIEFWANFNNSNNEYRLIGGYEDASNFWRIEKRAHNDPDGNLYFRWTIDDVDEVLVTTGSSLSWVDGTWYHIALVRNGSSYVIYRDGVSVTSATASGTLSDISSALYIGQQGSSSYTDGYFDEIRISDSARYTSSFTPSTTAFTADSNTKLLIHSDFDGGLGADSSGNTNDFTPTNLVATDQVLDSPTNNFATLNPLNKTNTGLGANSFLAEGNLKLEARGQTSVTSTFAVNSGKWYWECLVSSVNWWPVLGFAKTTANLGVSSSNWTGDVTDSWGYLCDNGAWYVDASIDATYTAVSAGDILQFAIDMDAGKAWVGINNTWVNSGNPGTGANAIVTSGLTGDITPVVSDSGASGNDVVTNFGADSSFSGAKTAQGNQDGNGIGDFYYTPPTGFKALCSDNLSDPSIADPTAHFDTTLYTGTGATKSISSLAFAPDMTWIKSRDNNYLHNLQDTIRGAGESLFSNNSDAETTDADSITSFDSNGWTMGADNSSWTVNKSGPTYVGWAWKAGGTASSNTDGTITSSVSANTTAGFSIVSFTGTGSNGTIGHGLSQAPELVIVKNRDTSPTDWQTGSDYLTSWAYRLKLNDSVAEASVSTSFNSTAPTASVVNIGSNSDVNNSTDAMIMYCFHSVDGYSKVGSYTGNGSSDGPMIYTGFNPSFILRKKISNATNSNWLMQDIKRFDGYNSDEATRNLAANLSDAEPSSASFAGNEIDFVSNGFKIRSTATNGNESGSTYIYLAFAESPFKTSNAR